MINAKRYGAQNMIGKLESVIVRRPGRSFGEADPQQWHYTGVPNLDIARAEHSAFTEIIQNQIGAEIIYHDVDLPEHADAIYVHDPILICDAGDILLRMGKALRRGEEAALGKTLTALEIPVHYELSAPAMAEGGDLLWLDDDTLAVGQGFRTNAAAFAQLREALPDTDLIPVHLPYD